MGLDGSTVQMHQEESQLLRLNDTATGPAKKCESSQKGVDISISYKQRQTTNMKQILTHSLDHNIQLQYVWVWAQSYVLILFYA